MSGTDWRSLFSVSEMCEENKMAASNLAIVFGPTLMRAENETPEMMVNMNFQVHNTSRVSGWLSDWVWHV